MLAVSTVPSVVTTDDRVPASGETASQGQGLTFDEVYDAHFAFVWRSVRRLGVLEGAVDDVAQEIFLVVHRRLPEFEGRSAVKTWLFGIVLRVVREHRRHLRRKSPHSLRPEPPADPETLSDSPERCPHESAAKTEAVRALHGILDELDDDKREVFILAELEQMTVPEIADALAVNLNTVYSRLRAARQEFEQAVARHRARDGWRYR
jgi:RNA polymerase sigma-70 factor (ECF subfamily)